MQVSYKLLSFPFVPSTFWTFDDPTTFWGAAKAKSGCLVVCESCLTSPVCPFVA